MTQPATPAQSRVEQLLGSTEPIRRALYPIAVALVALLVGYGIIDDQRAVLWIGLAVAVLVPGGIEAARRVAYSPASVVEYGREWQAAAEDEYARGVTAGLERTPDKVAQEIIDDEPGEHAEDRPTGTMRAQSRATRCREIEDGRRCLLVRGHTGPHHMTTG